VLVQCVWGDECGAVLRAGGASIPRPSQSKGLVPPSSVFQEQDRWQLLSFDPLLELRLLTLRPAGPSPRFDPRGSVTPIQDIDKRIHTFVPSSELTKSFEQVGIFAAALEAAVKRVRLDLVCSEALKCSGDDLGEFLIVWARAVVSVSLSALPDEKPIFSGLVNNQTRTDLASQLAAELGNQPKGLSAGAFLTRCLSILTPLVSIHRHSYTNDLVPFLGDVLVYQGNGQPIRNKIWQCIQDAGVGPVVLLGHSLGGVACVDLLAANAIPTAALLITVGSQAPLFYEMDALQKLRYGEPLPDHFPKWLNIYDLRDFLSYIGKPVFNDSLDRVVDAKVDNRELFPYAHNAYWENTQTWEIINKKLAEVHR
jgi:hypothetical protein